MTDEITQLTTENEKLRNELDFHRAGTRWAKDNLGLTNCPVCSAWKLEQYVCHKCGDDEG